MGQFQSARMPSERLEEEETARLLGWEAGQEVAASPPRILEQLATASGRQVDAAQASGPEVAVLEAEAEVEAKAELRATEAIEEFKKQMAKMGMLETFEAECDKHKVLKEEVKKERKKKVKEEGGRTCDYKDCEEKGKERCSGCNFAYYCSKECQVKAWGEHKEECKETKKEFKTVLVRKEEVFPPGHPLFDPVRNTVTQGAFRVRVGGGKFI